MNHLVPTHDEFVSCGDDAQIVGVGGSHKGPSIVLKFAFRTGDTGIVCLDESGIRHLVAVLKVLVPKFEAIGGLHVTVDTASGVISTSSPS